MSKFPDKFRIPNDRIPKAWSQGPYDCCATASVTKVLEVNNYVNTGTYTMLSKGYTYGRHSSPNLKSFKHGGGVDYDYTMKSILERGSVPEEMYPHMNEIPNIIFDVEGAENLAALDKEAEKTKAKEVIKIPGDGFFKDNVKKYLMEKQMPLVGNVVGWPHCTVIVGWDVDGFEFCDHDGRVDEETGRSWVYGGGKFNTAYYIDGGIEEVYEMPKEYKRFDTVDGFKKYIDGLNVTRSINLIQLHHTYSPSYKDFKGENHIALQDGMRNYHISERDMVDIAQQFTIFPDGAILTGRNINTAPAGIKGANADGICIECLGNFDKGGDEMTEAQKNAIVGVVKVLLDKFNLSAADNVTYHAWWSTDGRELGDYFKGHSAKTCPGTNFFGGNSLTAYHKNLMPLIENYGKVETMKPITEINDIVWELINAGIVTNGKLWLKKCEEDINVYWLCRKMANKLRGTLE